MALLVCVDDWEGNFSNEEWAEVQQVGLGDRRPMRLNSKRQSASSAKRVKCIERQHLQISQHRRHNSPAITWQWVCKDTHDVMKI